MLNIIDNTNQVFSPRQLGRGAIHHYEKQKPISEQEKYDMSLKRGNIFKVENMYNKSRVCSNCHEIYTILQHPKQWEYMEKFYKEAQREYEVDQLATSGSRHNSHKCG